MKASKKRSPANTKKKKPKTSAVVRPRNPNIGVPIATHEAKASRKARANAVKVDEAAERRKALEAQGIVIYGTSSNGRRNPLKGNQLWQMRSVHGLNPAMTPEDFVNCAIDYFKWIDENPLESFGPDNKIRKHKRPYTVRGLCMMSGIDENTYYRYLSGEGYKQYWDAAAKIDIAIKQQKFDGAIAGYFNASIISRDLGLVDKQVQLPPPPLTPPAQPSPGDSEGKPTGDITEKDALAAYRALIAGNPTQQ